MSSPAITASEVGIEGSAAGIRPPICGFCGAEAVLAYERFDWFEHHCQEYSRWIEKWAGKRPRPGQAVVPLLTWDKDGSPMNGRLSPKDLAMLFLDRSVGRCGVHSAAHLGNAMGQRRSGDREPVTAQTTPNDGQVSCGDHPGVA